MASERPAAASQPPTLQTRTPETPPRTATQQAEAESPSISAPHARARFEFENGRGNNGTKVLMVEWEDDAVTSKIAGRWTVAWDGHSATQHGQDESILMPASESLASSTTGGGGGAAVATSPRKQRKSHEVETSAGKTHRIYFLLGVRKQVPSIVTLTLAPYDSSVSSVVWKTNPLPAIFPPGLADAETTKGKGVLHNIWATKRLQRLDSEIEKEAKANCEGIGIQLALSEREWIERDFGLTSQSVAAQEDSKSPTIRLPPHHPPTGLGISPAQNQAPMSPTSPLSPGGSRLSEKLKGLKLQTAPADDEVAVPACREKIEKMAAAASSSKPSTPQSLPASSAARAAATTQTGMSSIGAVLAVGGATSRSSESDAEDDDGDEHDEEEEEQELFALPLSPRSPEMTKSPFSWAAEDTRRYINTARAS